jgi:hypothetical protein
VGFNCGRARASSNQHPKAEARATWPRAGGQRFLVRELVGGSAGPQINVALNWQAALKK